jgi:hypothetical protein
MQDLDSNESALVCAYGLLRIVLALLDTQGEMLASAQLSMVIDRLEFDHPTLLEARPSQAQ